MLILVADGTGGSKISAADLLQKKVIWCRKCQEKGWFVVLNLLDSNILISNISYINGSDKDRYSA